MKRHWRILVKFTTVRMNMIAYTRIALLQLLQYTHDTTKSLYL